MWVPPKVWSGLAYPDTIILIYWTATTKFHSLYGLTNRNIFLSDVESQTWVLANKTNLEVSLLMFAENRILAVSHGLFSDQDLYFFLITMSPIIVN